MAFDPGQAQAVKSLFSNGVPPLDKALKALPGVLDFAIRNHHDLKVRLLYTAAKPIIQKIGEFAEQIAVAFNQLLGSVGAPLWLFDRGLKWKLIKQDLTNMAAKIDGFGPELNPYWKGDAFNGYKEASATQSKAITNLANAAGAASSAMDAAALSGVGFYTAAATILVDVAKTVAASEAATVVTDAVGTLPALGVLAMKMWEATKKLGGVIKSLVALAALAAGQLGVEHALSGQPEGMPDGKWPMPVTANFNDASVTDKPRPDPTDWNIKT